MKTDRSLGGIDLTNATAFARIIPLSTLLSDVNRSNMSLNPYA